MPIWIATHPYKGIVHDGRLYTIQALNGLEGGRFSQDLYFRFGSQDSLSFFSFFYEPLIAALGPARGHLCATVLGAVAWVAALTFLLRSLLSNRREMLAAAVACIVLDADYGGLNVFHYGENFVTPRIFAESLVMVALAFCMRGRAVGCSLCLLAAAAIHPIMAATGMAVAGAWAVFQDRRVLILIGAGAFTGIVLAMVGVPPFARLLATFDPDWYAIVWKRCGFAFLSRWSAGNALHVAAVGSTLWAAYVLGNATERRLIACVAIASAGGLLASLAGGEIFHNVLLVNVQPWRMLWLATLLANAAIAIVLIRLPPSRFSREMFFWAAGLSALTTVGLQLAPVAAMTQLLAALAFGFEEKRRAPLPRAAQLLSVIPPLAGTAATAGLLYLKTEMSDVWPALALTGLLIAACLILAFGEADKLRGAFLYSAMLAAILASLALFDQRSDWQKFLETGPPS
ncbi:MAG: hypothetical protein J2P49_06470, partial [Methylocapsa sp.]|nr:hypothetical protein [Methylocapsa sp.]